MTRDLSICKRILLEFVQNDKYHTEEKRDAYHVALMIDRGYVEGRVERDESGFPANATIGRMTAVGHDAYEREFLDPDKSSWEVSKSDYYNSLVVTKRENELARDKMLSTIATGGIALGFGVVSYLLGQNVKVEYVPWIIAVTFWGLTLVGLLASDHVGGGAIDDYIDRMNSPDSEEPNRKTWRERVAPWLNLSNCISAIAGVAAFTWFIVACIRRIG